MHSLAHYAHLLPSFLLRLLLTLGCGLWSLSFAAANTLNFSPLNFSLQDYEVVATYLLPPGDFSGNPAVINAHEASAVTYHWDNDSLLVIGDEGGHVVEVDFQGNMLSKMAVVGFNDPEGITYAGNGTIVVVEERNRDAYQFAYVGGSFVFKSSLTPVDLGTFVDNIGLEGISYDPRDGSYITIKEKQPQEVNSNQLDFATGNAIITPLFTPNLGVSDLAAVQALATIPAFNGSELADQLLLFSQESARLLRTDRLGTVLDSLDFTAYADSAEGVTMDFNGTIYIVAENGSAPQLFVLQNTSQEEEVPFLPWWALLAVLVCLGKLGRYSNSSSNNNSSSRSSSKKGSRILPSLIKNSRRCR